MKIAPLLLVPLLSAALASVAEAQYYGDGYGDYHASTVGESYANGAANVIRSQGQANLQNSEALINVTTARSADLDNELKNAQVYFEMRNLNRQQRFGDYPERKAINSQKRLFRYGQEGRPTRPSRKELDPLTGRITWPIFMQTDTFKEPRQAVDRLFLLRARQQGAIGGEGYDAMVAATNEMLAALKGDINQLDPKDYVTGKNFVERLAYEARYPIE